MKEMKITDGKRMLTSEVAGRWEVHLVGCTRRHYSYGVTDKRIPYLSHASAIYPNLNIREPN